MMKTNIYIWYQTLSDLNPELGYDDNLTNYRSRN